MHDTTTAAAAARRTASNARGSTAFAASSPDTISTGAFPSPSAKLQEKQRGDSAIKKRKQQGAARAHAQQPRRHIRPQLWRRIAEGGEDPEVHLEHERVGRQLVPAGAQ